MLSKNSASSRAIPFKKMVEMVETDPFIPIAWQKEHKGMQGTEYITNSEEIDKCYMSWVDTCEDIVIRAEHLSEQGVTKQLANRLLEPFMWHTVLISGTEWENFFELRCPQYTVSEYSMYDDIEKTHVFRSKKDLLKSLGHSSDGHFYVHENDIYPMNKRGLSTREFTDLHWLHLNKGQAEIHMMALAEAIWDAMNESKPIQLKAGDWHIPFEEKILISGTEGIEANTAKAVKISTAMAARTSYTVVGEEKEIGYDKLIAIHDRMAIAKPFHASPFEHCARAMNHVEFETMIKGEVEYRPDAGRVYVGDSASGWCRNYRGFIQYRHILESKL